MRSMRGRPNDHAGDDAAANVRRFDSGHADRLSSGLHAGRARAVVRLPVDLSRLLRHELPAGHSGPHLRQRAVQRIAAGYSLLHLHGRDSRALRSRRRHAGFDGQLFGPIRGGLGYSVIIVGFILGAITGTVAAQVIAMALISMPVMMRYGYNIRYITGVLAASGTITQLVPPSLVLIVMADQLGKSVGDMYLGAWGPSVFQIALFAGYTFILGLIKPDHVPPVPIEARTLTGWPLWKKCLMGIIPSAVLIFVVLGTMMMGLATPTEAGAMGAIGAIVLAAIHHKDFSATGSKVLIAGIIALGIGAIIAILFSDNIYFKLAFAVVYLAIVWICLEAVRIPDLRDLIKQGYQTTMRITCMVVFI